MRTASLSTNLRCNQRCTYCNQRADTDNLARIAPTAIRAEVRARLAQGAEELVFTGGEPTMRGDLPELVRFARTEGASSVVVATNATLLDAPRARALADAGTTIARVNLAAWGDALDVITGDDGGFARTLGGLVALRDAGIRIELSTVVVRSTREVLAQLPGQLVDALGANTVRLVRLAVPVEAPDPRELLAYEEVVPTILSFEREARGQGIAVQLQPDAAPPPCVFPKQERASTLYSLTPGGLRTAGFTRVAACQDCLARDRCSGFPTAYLARRAPPPLTPIVEDRVRRRLSVISSTENQIERELVQHNRTLEGDDAIIRVIFNCNQACHFCFVSTHLPGAADERIEAAIREAGALGQRIVLSGGEPTLHPRLPRLVALAKSVSERQVELQTNAIRLADPARVAELEAAGLDLVFVSLHAATAETSDALTQAPGTFARTLLGLDSLAQSRIALTLNFVLGNTNHAELPAYMRMVGERWPNASINLSVAAATTDLVPTDRGLLPRYADVRASIEAGLAEAKARGVRVSGFESMCGLPLCVVPEVALGRDMPVIEAGYDAGEFVKPLACQGCALTQYCYGFHRRYADLHGTDEARPIAPSLIVRPTGDPAS